MPTAEIPSTSKHPRTHTGQDLEEYVHRGLTPFAKSLLVEADPAIEGLAPAQLFHISTVSCRAGRGEGGGLSRLCTYTIMIVRVPYRSSMYCRAFGP